MFKCFYFQFKTSFYFLNMFQKRINGLCGSHCVSLGQCCPWMLENEPSVPDAIPPTFFSLSHLSLPLLLSRMWLGDWPLPSSTMNVTALPYLVPLRKALRFLTGLRPWLLWYTVAFILEGMAWTLDFYNSPRSWPVSITSECDIWNECYWWKPVCWLK